MWIRDQPIISGIALAALGILVVGAMGIVSSSSDRSTVRQLDDRTGVTERGIHVGAVTKVRTSGPGIPSRTRPDEQELFATAH